MSSATDGFKYERRGLRGQRQLEQRQSAVELQLLFVGREQVESG